MSVKTGSSHILSLEDWQAQFKFKPQGAGLIGVEQECHLTIPDHEGETQRFKVAPISPRVLEHLGISPSFGYELSACQLEHRVGPVELGGVRDALAINERILKQAELDLGFGRSYYEVGPADMPLDVYPRERYRVITQGMPRHILEAACRVIAVHIHVGMPDHETALRVYNNVISDCNELCILGDHSNGERLRLYKMMAGEWIPPEFKTWEDFYQRAIQKKFVHDPRQCWRLIRISIHGTIEFRMFGASNDHAKIMRWAQMCHDKCQRFM